MLDNNTLKDLLSSTDIKRTDKILLILAVAPDMPKKVLDIRLTGTKCGLPKINKWNISDILSREKSLVSRLPGGWIVTSKGKEHLVLGGFISKKRPAVKNVADDLRKQLDKIKDANTKTFLEEAISCFEINRCRAAVVLSWVGAVSVLYHYVANNKLSEFNAEALRRNSKWKRAKTPDDLSRMKEWNFLDILEAISVIGNDVKKELQNNCLTLRNSCGHPNSLIIRENRVAAHLEVLIDNVFSKF